jgi:hypothetical protein
LIVFLGEMDALADLAIGHALGHQLDDAPLLSGQLFDAPAAATGNGIPRIRASTRSVAVGSRSDSPRPRAMNRIEQIVAPHLLEHVAGCAGDNCAEEGFVVCERGEDEHPRLLSVSANIPTGLDA